MSEAAQRIEKRLAELNRSMIEDNNIAQPASRIPVKEPTSPSVDGGRDVSSVAKVQRKIKMCGRKTPICANSNANRDATTAKTKSKRCRTAYRESTC